MNKIFFLLAVLTLSSCKTSSVSGLNPMNGIIDALDKEPVATTDEITEDYLQEVNDHRIKLGLRPFIYSPVIESETQMHSLHMAQKLVPFGHEGSLERCKRINDALNGKLCGEIVGRGHASAQILFKALMSSSSHRSKMESERYTHFGFGSVKDSAGMTYWTQIFLEVP